MLDYTDPQYLWWDEKEPQKAGKLMLAMADALYTAQQGRRDQNLLYAKLFANQDLRSIYDCGVMRDGLAGAYLSVNVTESCANTLVAKMTRSRIRPSIQTEKGNRSLQRSAEQGTDFIDGVYHESELHEGEGEQMFVDGALFGNGWAYTEADDDQITVERVLPDEMLFDETEAVYGMRSLFTIYRRKYIHRQALYRMLDDKGRPFADDKDKRAAIKAAEGFQRPGQSYSVDGAHMIPVRFAWRLPSRREAGDGRMLVAIDGATLYAREWKRSRFPFDVFNFQRKPVGLYGRGLAEQLVPIQLNINEQLETIAEGQRLNAQVRILYKEGAIDPDQFDNEIGRLIALAAGFSMQDVQVLQGQGATKEMYDDCERWIRRAYEVTGISMLSATAEKPEGITSAVALRELLDREDLRFSALGKRWERFHRDIGETILDTAAEAHDDGTKLQVQVPGDKWTKTIDFGQLKLDRQKHVVTVAAASALPTTPAARKQYADDLLTRGAITMPRYLEIIDESGDVRGVTSLVTAVQESIDLDIEGILDHGRPCTPEKLRDPALARDTALAAYAKAVHEEVPEKHMELLRRYILLATRMAGPQGAPAGAAGDQAAVAQQAAQGPAGPPAAPPNGVPGQPEQLPPDLAAAAPTPAPPVTPVA
jgi:hypothetical protein